MIGVSCTFRKGGKGPASFTGQAAIAWLTEVLGLKTRSRGLRIARFLTKRGVWRSVSWLSHQIAGLVWDGFSDDGEHSFVFTKPLPTNTPHLYRVSAALRDVLGATAKCFVGKKAAVFIRQFLQLADDEAGVRRISNICRALVTHSLTHSLTHSSAQTAHHTQTHTRSLRRLAMHASALCVLGVACLCACAYTERWG